MVQQSHQPLGLSRYVPRLSAEWHLHTDEPWRQIDGTLCYVDISGFTALSEKLARRGRIGAEELTEVLDHVFAKMLGIAYDRGGNLLKFGGDALLLVFRGDDHPLQACSAAVEMQAALREASLLPDQCRPAPAQDVGRSAQRPGPPLPGRPSRPSEHRARAPVAQRLHLRPPGHGEGAGTGLARPDRTRNSRPGPSHRRARAVRRWQQRPADALRLAEQAESEARSVGDLETLALALDLIDWDNRMTGRTDHPPNHAEALAIFEQLDDMSGIAIVCNNLGAEAYWEGDWDGAVDAHTRSREAELRNGNDVQAAIPAVNTAELLINRGRHDQAEPLPVDAIRVLTASGHAAVGLAKSELARLLIRRGDHPRPRSCSTRSGRGATPTPNR